MTSKGHSGPNIWPETLNQNTGTEETIFTTWYKKVMKQSRINSLQYHPPIFSTKEAYYISYTSSN